MGVLTLPMETLLICSRCPQRDNQSVSEAVGTWFQSSCGQALSEVSFITFARARACLSSWNPPKCFTTTPVAALSCLAAEIVQQPGLFLSGLLAHTR